MKVFVGNTDWNWYEFLRDGHFEEVNFWRPGGGVFRSLEPGELFLFKMKASRGRKIAGGGFFVEYRSMSIEWAWRAFERENGANNLPDLAERIRVYRKDSCIDILNAQIGCIILSDVFYLDEIDWFLAPNFGNSIVVGKTYDTDDRNTADDARWLLDQVRTRLQGKALFGDDAGQPDIASGYTVGLAKHRIGQGVFRARVADAYSRRCAITGERTFPVLQAAHIQAFSDGGPHAVNNGLLLRSDVHTLFDAGYLTLTNDLRIEVSGRLRDDWHNGREYYALHGHHLAVIPEHPSQRPAAGFLDWHHEHVFLG